LEENVGSIEQATARRQLADGLAAVLRRGLGSVVAALASDHQWGRWSEEMARLAVEGELLGQPLDRELHLQAGEPPVSLAEAGRNILALDKWAVRAKKWSRLFAFSQRKAAAAAVERLALELNVATTERAQAYYRALKARHLWQDLIQRLLGSKADPTLSLGGGLMPDEMLLKVRDGLPEILAMLGWAERPGNQCIRAETLRAVTSRETCDVLVARLRASTERAEAIEALEKQLASTGLFREDAIAQWARAWRRGESAAEEIRRLIEFEPTLEEAIRLAERLGSLPAPVRQGLTEAALRGLGWSEAEPALRWMALGREIRGRLQSDPALARIDNQRVEAAFAESLERRAEKVELVRQHILYRWQDRWRSRLLATTGSRLNSLGASLRQRLFVRGQKAMKLRQMIAAGVGIDGGDPLFDLCPVWMAGPATVAQIFPRQACFDVVVFDEASQCRLEEALPVLLRGRRVVIAGDPQQLPPTRFFEQSLADGEEVGAETLEEVFAQQQSEAEDLLSAALNLDVQESFLDVHYRSRHEALIDFSNHSFYGGRLQPIPGHPGQRPTQPPIRLIRVDGVYHDRGNEAEAAAAAKLVASLLESPNPPSIGVACFNLNQRDLLLDALDELAEADSQFAERLAQARERRGADSFEGLFVKNLENVQGDERDHLIISTTFGPDGQGRFRRNFGALSRAGGERRLNVLVTRARECVHVLTSVPPMEYRGADRPEDERRVTGRHYLYGYLRAAEELAAAWSAAKIDEATKTGRKNGREEPPAGREVRLEVRPTNAPSRVTEALAKRVGNRQAAAATVYWGNDGFCVDLALEMNGSTQPVGILADFTRYRRTPDPIAWEQFRTSVLTKQGWLLRRIWSPTLFRATDQALHQIGLGP
jgi:hypothetical protein